MIGKCLLGYLEILSWPSAAYPKILRGMKKEIKKERKKEYEANFTYHLCFNILLRRTKVNFPCHLCIKYSAYINPQSLNG